jgi:hypothetical protein
MKDRLNKPILFRTILVISLFLTVVFITGSGVSCQSQEPASAPPAPSPGLPKEPTSGESNSQMLASWSADGVIGSREYLSEMTYDGYELYWVNDEESVYVAMKAKTNGWVSLGIQPGSGMKDSDIIIGFVKDGKASVLDRFSTGVFGPHPPDTELGGTFDIIDFGGNEADGYTVIEFKRDLDTGDQYDKKLSIGENKIIWAYGLDDTPTTMHTKRGQGEITITGQ